MKYVESAYIEQKEMINTDFKKEIIAFANTDGGEIYVGISKNGDIIGVADPEKNMERISNMIRDSIKPDLIPFTSISMFYEQNLPVIKVSVNRGERGPYCLSEKGLKLSGVFIRHGVTSEPANEDTIRQMIRESDGLSFDRVRSINQELTFNDASNFFSVHHLSDCGGLTNTTIRHLLSVKR